MNEDEILTNEQIEERIDQELSEMSEEEREAMLALDDAADRLAIIKLRQRFGVNVELIPNDRHHIRLDGQVIGYNEFQDWIQERLAQEAAAANPAQA